MQRVKINIGINEYGSSQPTMKTPGSKQIKGIITPFRRGGNCRFEVASMNPETTQKKNTERCAPQVNPIEKVGMELMIPATAPSIKPYSIFFFMVCLH